MINRERLTPRQQLIEDHTFLAYKIAREYTRGNDVPLEDLRQEAVMNLIVAVDGYDEAKGPFIPYAKRVIENGLLECVARNSFSVGASRSVFLRRGKMYQAAAELEARGEESTQDALAKQTGYSKSSIAGMQTLERKQVLTEKHTDELSSVAAEDVFPAESGSDIEKMLGAIEALDAQTRMMIERHFGLNGFEEETMTAIAASIGCSKQNVNQQIKAGMAEVRKALRDKNGLRLSPRL